jgi:hypothetical protein
MVYKNDQQNNRRNSERTYNISVGSNTSKRNLISFMREELNYYNALVVGFNSKIRVLDVEIENLKENNERIWLAVAQTATDLRSLATSPIDTWPEIFKPYAELIVKGNRLIISDRMMMLFDIAATKANIHPLIRRLIAAEVLHWIQPQAKQIAESNLSTTGQMRSPIQMLQPLEYIFKRHVQLINGLVEVTYDTENGSTLLKIPYSNEPILIEGHDLTKMPHDHFIIRQKTGEVPDESTPWQVTIREGSGKYLLDITDMSYVNKKQLNSNIKR